MFLFDWMKKQPGTEVPASSDEKTASCDALGLIQLRRHADGNLNATRQRKTRILKGGPK